MLIEEITDRPLTPQQKQLLQDMICLGFAPRDKFCNTICEGREDGGPLNIPRLLHSQICRIRKSLAPGWSIQTRHWWGYELCQV